MMTVVNASVSVRRVIRGPALVAAGLATFLAPLLANAMAQNIQRPEIPKWEAVSVKPCAVRGPRGGGARLSPGRMALNCQPVSAFISWAYVQYAGGRAHPFYAVGNGGTAVEGGPSWIYSDRYTIEATVNGAPSHAVMQGPMLQAILEDRFKVKVHTETREVPVYHLTVAPGGAKLRPFKSGTCVPINVHREEPVPPPLPHGERYCDSFVTPKGSTLSIHAEGSSVEEFVTLFLSTLSFAERRVIDRTGVTGLFDIEFEFALPRSADNPAADQTGVSIFTALREQLGLRLESARGPGQFLVIDSVERPTEN
jgi:uncharacterized protein (TIGR03435 family)